MNTSDIEIVAEKFKSRFSNFLITELEKIMVFHFYKKAYVTTPNSKELGFSHLAKAPSEPLSGFSCFPDNYLEA
jgi:hypothetical protein